MYFYLSFQFTVETLYLNVLNYFACGIQASTSGVEQGFSKTAAVVGRGNSSAEYDMTMVKFMLTKLTASEVDELIQKSRQLYQQCAPGQTDWMKKSMTKLKQW